MKLPMYIVLINSQQWALIELSRKLDKQNKLRSEIASLGGVDPSWEQITSGLPYLDAVVHEVLRLHPPVGETTRVVRQCPPFHEICVLTLDKRLLRMTSFLSAIP